MSFAIDENDQPESQLDESQQGGTGLGTANPKNNNQVDSTVNLGGGGSGVVSPGGGNVGGNNQTAAAQTQKPTNSGSWTNLQSYLAANSDQGAQVGSQIAGTITGQAEGAKNDINSAASDFSNNVNANTVNADANSVSKAVSDAQNANAGWSANPDDVSNFQKQYNASYGGPTDFTKQSGYGTAQNDINTANTSLAQTGSEAGRDVLLQNQYKNTSANGYNQGEQGLDQMLLENTPANQTAFEGLRGQYSGLSQMLADETAKQNAAAQGAVQTDAATAAAAHAALDPANQQLQNTLNSQLAGVQSKNPQAQYQKIMDDIHNGTMTRDELEALGMGQGETTYGVDPSKYMSAFAAPTVANTASADQYAQAHALAQLAGQSDSPYLSQAYASQAGKGNNPYAFDSSKFNADIATRQAQGPAIIAAYQANPLDPAATAAYNQWISDISKRYSTDATAPIRSIAPAPITTRGPLGGSAI